MSAEPGLELCLLTTLVSFPPKCLKCGDIIVTIMTINWSLYLQFFNNARKFSLILNDSRAQT